MLIGCALVASALFSGLVTAQSPGLMSITVSTPLSLFECNPVYLSWTGGVAPYTLGIYQAGSLTDRLETLSQTSDTNFVWTVDQPAGASVVIGVVDSQGNSGFSATTPAIGSGSTGW